MSYAGDLSPQEAWAKLEDGAILVDVRTEGEWTHIGIPDTASAGGTRNDPLFIQWNLAGGVPNARVIEQLNLQLVQRALGLDGTCTGEHGVGLHKMRYLEEEHGEAAVAVMRRIKQALDPLDILNPGKVVQV